MLPLFRYSGWESVIVNSNNDDGQAKMMVEVTLVMMMMLLWQDIGFQQKNKGDRGRHLPLRIHPGSHKQADRLDFLKVSELIL